MLDRAESTHLYGAAAEAAQWANLSAEIPVC